MKLWDSLTTCLILLSAVGASPLRAAESAPEHAPVQIRLSVVSSGFFIAETVERETLQRGAKGTVMKEPHPGNFEDVMDFIKVTISRIRRSSSSGRPSSTSSPFAPTGKTRTRHRRERKKGAKDKKVKEGRVTEDVGRRSRGKGGRGQGQGCVLKQIHLNVTDLGLGYHSSEEMIFRYCSGPCKKSYTNYDKILLNLIRNRNIPLKDTPLQACCRPIAFDDDLSFLDDSLVYHTVRKHSARKCGCV
ncbi:glial cell line-derived neurotrophic factor [Oryzias latipes]|uniref:Glial cell line-derived neurotrophic factor n=1 Tax=Oryzias latipes TaxID=8090 RepID=A0A3B3I9Y6_ORYLA|nr:glial cell line-derived neurotrophic factor [Oryzias latipes]XP_011477345.1 glial cell line-derived neurotrophic factor [Oryzias latipes]